MTILAVAGLVAHYGHLRALDGIDLEVAEAEAVAIIGANGAGKTTLLRAITGLLPVEADAVRFLGAPIGGLPPDRIVEFGIALVPEGRRLFASLSVEDNLRMGAHCARPGPWTLERVYRTFPRIAGRCRAPATALSGGEQQMVAIGRALMANPRLLLCDELSLGLAPVVIETLYATLAEIRASGTTIILVEQDLSRALVASDRVYCLREGRVVLTGRPADLSREAIRLAYFGV